MSRLSSLLVLIALVASGPARAEETEVDRIVAHQRALPVRDLSRDAASRRLLARHPVFVSLTTSPRRIEHVPHVLDALDLTHVTKVFVVLPERFGRTGERYRIPPALARHPKVEIIRIERDLGPISKMLPAIERARRIDRRSIVISVDDDAAYPRGMVPEIIYHLARSRRTVVGGAVPSASMFGVDLARWRRSFPHDREARLAEGSGAVGYRAGEVNTRLLRRLHGLSSSTRASDDLVINYVLARSGIERRAIKTEYFNRKMIRFLPYGFEADALHRGAGFAGLPTGVADFNNVKYVTALEEIDGAMSGRRRRAATRFIRWTGRGRAALRTPAIRRAAQRWRVPTRFARRRR